MNATPNFPAGQLLAQDPAASMLHVLLLKGPTDFAERVIDVADLVPVDTAGVEPSSVSAWEDALCDEPDYIQRKSKTLEFRCTGTNADCVAIAYAVLAFDGTRTVLMTVEPLDAPRAMAAPGDNVILTAMVVAMNLAAA